MRSDPPDRMSLLSYWLRGVLGFQQGNRTNSSGIHFHVIPEPALTLHRHWLQVMQGKVDNLDEQARKVEANLKIEI
jgi:hypothetical protein